jgi:hypothetical protein
LEGVIERLKQSLEELASAAQVALLACFLIASLKVLFQELNGLRLALSDKTVNKPRFQPQHFIPHPQTHKTQTPNTQPRQKSRHCVFI